jgi:hypothetical protein
MELNEAGLPSPVVEYFGARIREAHATRRIAIVAVIGRSHDTGQPLMVAPLRHEMVEYIQMARDAARSPNFVRSVCGDIRGAVMIGLGSLSPAQRTDLLSNIALLMAAKLATGDDHVIEGSGLASVTVVVDHNRDLPWDRRGFLTPADAVTPGHA